MNDQLPTDQRELELTTSRKISASGNGSSLHDAKAIAARNAWLSLGAAVEANGRDGLDQDALLATLQAELLKEQAAPAASDVAGQVDWSWAAVVVAASVLIAATVIGVISQRSDKVPGADPGEQLVQPSLPNKLPPSKPVPSAEPQDLPSVEAQSNPALAGTPATSSWNDLDDAINSTYTVLQQMTVHPSGVDQSLTDFDSQLKQLSADISGESL